MIGLTEPIDRLTMANSVRLCEQVVSRKDSDVLRKALEFKVEGHRKTGKLRRTFFFLYHPVQYMHAFIHT